MNDDELDKLFEDPSEETNEDNKPSNEGDIEAPSNVTIEEEGEATDSEDSSEEEAEKKADKEAEAKKKKDEEERKKQERIKAEKKRQAKIDTIKKIEKLELEHERKVKERKERRETLGPIKDRKYLEDFPLSFRTTLIILLSLIALIIVWSIAFHPYFRVGKITIIGNHEVSDERILSELGIDYGNHMFRNYISSGNDLVEHDPYIQSVSITRNFPSSIEIEVKERKKIAYISTPDGYIAIDEEGVVLELCADKDADVRPLLCGLDINSVTLGKKVNILNDNSFRKMIIVLSAALSASEAYRGVPSPNMDYDFFESILEIRIIKSGMLFVTVELPDGTDLQVKLKDINSINDDMQWLVYSIEENAFQGLPNGVLDMTGEEYIYRKYEI